MTHSAKAGEATSASAVALAVPSARPDPAAMEFLIFQDNGGAYRWRIVAGDGATLAQSGSFASYERAEQAAHQVRDGAASARLDRRASEAPPVDLAAARDRPSDGLDAERWLNEGGSFSSGEMSKSVQNDAQRTP